MALKSWGNIANPTPNEEFLKSKQIRNRDKKTISKIYNAGSSMIKHNSLRMREIWEAEINKKNT